MKILRSNIINELNQKIFVEFQWFFFIMLLFFFFEKIRVLYRCHLWLSPALSNNARPNEIVSLCNGELYIL